MEKVQEHLSGRMQAIAGMALPGKRLCDVGCDHAYLSIALVYAGTFSSALATDLRPGPLSRAKENIKKAGLSEQIQTRLSDGLSAVLPGECDTILIAGMGGALIARILAEGSGVLLFNASGREGEEKPPVLVLQPQSDVSALRRYLMNAGYTIDAEDMVFEDGKYYFMMRAVLEKKAHPYDETELLCGPCLIADKNPVLLSFLKRRISADETILKKLSSRPTDARILERRKELSFELSLYRSALERMTV